MLAEPIREVYKHTVHLDSQNSDQRKQGEHHSDALNNKSSQREMFLRRRTTRASITYDTDGIVNGRKLRRP